MITLRHFSMEDAGSVHDGLYPDMKESDIMKMLTEWNSCLYQGRYAEMFAVLSDGRIVGYVSLYERSRSVASAGVEIWPGERGKGFASEAMAALLTVAAEKGYRLILDQVLRSNQASIRLHEKLGFECDGYIYRNRNGHEVFLYTKLLCQEVKA